MDTTKSHSLNWSLITPRLHSKKEKKHLLADIEKISKIGGWELNLDTMQILFTDVTYAILNLTLNDEIALSSLVGSGSTSHSLKVREAFQSSVEKQEPLDIEYYLDVANGKNVFVRLKGTFEKNNKRNRFYGTLEEISEQNLKEIKLEEFSQFFHLSPNLMSISDSNGYFIKVNLAWSKLLGYSEKELKSRPFIEFVHPEDVDITNKYAAKLIKEPCEITNFVNRYKVKGGGYRWCSWMCKSVKEYGGRVYSATRDITAERVTHEELEKLSIVAEKTDNFVMVTDKYGYLEWVNEAFINFSGYSIDDLLNVKPGHLLQGKDSCKSEISRIKNAIKNKEGVNSEIINYKKDGTPYWVSIDIKPIFNKENIVERFISVQRDITQRKEQEKKLKTNISLLQKTNQELDSFVYRVSHDLRAPIASSLGLIEVCRMTNDSKSLHEYIDLQEKSMRKLDSFIRGILEYSKNTRQEIRKEFINLNSMIDSIFEEFQFKQNADKIKKLLKIEEEAPFYADKGRLEIILSNIISNGIKYSAPQKKHSYIDIRIKVDKDNAEITYTDNGLGIEESRLPHIFDMFYRGTDQNKGSGLGLYIVKEAIDKLNGKIDVVSEVNKGTNFKICLPNEISSNVNVANYPV